MRVHATVATVALFAVLAGGCARTGVDSGAVPGPVRSGPIAEVHERWESCDAAAPAKTNEWYDNAQDALGLPRLDGTFQPVAALICRNGIQERPGGGTEMTAEEARADDLSALLPALLLPDEAATAQACTADLPGVPWLALVDRDGRWVRPGIPIDSCSKPRTEFRQAYEKLVTVTVKSRVLRQMESDEAATAGCSQSYGDMTWASGGAENVRENTLAPLPVSTSARRCVYDVPVGERGSGKPAGEFRDGGPLSAADWAAIRTEIEASAPGSAVCRTPAAAFAVINLEPGGTVNIEADGCRRILAETGNGPGVYLKSSERLTELVFG
ncbi:hypothetical protein [Actinoplanes xinjiangensis]|uniref:Lipoprotein n=1 Tax=Actinoplanes xinjiangensis TaxID=512350 RepID=A0A316FZI5_9ACTN|nr:hypothetical protein [Actinoplanes xinjiangensis]PWK47567.1 hypothetical protein BC793_107177 [Actinoplanes xinjiangensis]GIF39506.1 hypothetical protein Axi01nite_38170 [Actinoplanes xinjiangensis]